MRLLRLFALVLVPALVPAIASAERTVAIAPLSTPDNDAHGWVGRAIADALSLRVHQQVELNATTLRQVNAALRHDNLRPSDMTDPMAAYKLGKQLGADVILVGNYRIGDDKKIDMVFKTYDPQNQKPLGTRTLNGTLDGLVEMEAEAARLLAKELGHNTPDVFPGAFGTTNMDSWRLTTQALRALNWQSLNPRAADPKTKLKLSKDVIRGAMAKLEDAVRYDPEFGEAWAALGVARALLNQTPEAWRALGKATALGFGHHPTAVLGASFVRMREGRWDEAARILQSAINRHPGFTHARGYLGELYNHIDKHEQALEAFNAYAKRVPNQPWVLAQRGYTKAKTGDFPGAIADTIAATDILPDSPALLLQLASRYIDAGKLTGAEDALMQAIKKHPGWARIYVRLGYVYLLQGKDELAIPITEKALVEEKIAATRRDRAYAHLNLARAYGHKGDLDKAFTHLEEAKSHGLASLREVEADPGLDGLRGDPRYKKIKW